MYQIAHLVSELTVVLRISFNKIKPKFSQMTLVTLKCSVAYILLKIRIFCNNSRLATDFPLGTHLSLTETSVVVHALECIVRQNFVSVVPLTASLMQYIRM